MTTKWEDRFVTLSRPPSSIKSITHTHTWTSTHTRGQHIHTDAQKQTHLTDAHNHIHGHSYTCNSSRCLSTKFDHQVHHTHMFTCTNTKVHTRTCSLTYAHTHTHTYTQRQTRTHNVGTRRHRPTCREDTWRHMTHANIQRLEGEAAILHYSYPCIHLYLSVL